MPCLIVHRATSRIRTIGSAYCVPFMMNEGMENDQAVAACLDDVAG